MERIIREYKVKIWEKTWGRYKDIHYGENVVTIFICIFTICVLVDYFMKYMNGIQNRNICAIIFPVLVCVVIWEIFIERRKRTYNNEKLKNRKKLKKIIRKERINEKQIEVMLFHCAETNRQAREESFVMKAMEKYITLILIPIILSLMDEVKKLKIDENMLAMILIVILILFLVLVILENILDIRKRMRNKDGQMYDEVCACLREELFELHKT